ncbi:MAG: hypothetical protein R3C32_07480 [Chloroflexota bacterium]
MESVFAGVRLRTRVAKRARTRESALYLVFKVAQRLSGSWAVLGGGAIIKACSSPGARFRDGGAGQASAALAAEEVSTAA